MALTDTTGKINPAPPMASALLRTAERCQHALSPGPHLSRNPETMRPDDRRRLDQISDVTHQSRVAAAPFQKPGRQHLKASVATPFAKRARRFSSSRRGSVLEAIICWGSFAARAGR